MTSPFEGVEGALSSHCHCVGALQLWTRHNEEVARPGTQSQVAEEPKIGQALELAVPRPCLPKVGAHI